MTIPATPRRAGPYNTNGATTAFGFTFKVFDEADVRVVVNEDGVESDAVLNSDFTVTLNADQEAGPGGTVNFLVPLNGPTITLVSGMEYSQPTQLPDGGAYRARTNMNALDRLAMLIQQIWEQFNRGIKFPVSDADDLVTELPTASERAGTAMVFDANGNVTVSPDIGATLATITASAAAAEASRDAIDNRFYPGSYASNPTTRPDGSPIQAGDEYFNSVANLKKRFNGATWVASDINTANLASSTGATLVGHDDTSGATVADSLHFFMRNIQPLRKYLPASVDYEAVLAGTSTEDHTTYIRDAFTHTNHLELPDGRINISDQIDLTGLNSVSLVGPGKGRWSDVAGSSMVGARIVHTGTNKKGFRLANRLHLEGVAAEYSAQQAAASTDAIMFEFSGICRHPVVREVVSAYGNTAFGIAQSGTSAFFDGVVQGIEAWKASGTPLDFRNFNGGGTNCVFSTIYINGGMSLDRLTPGQSAQYALRFGRGSGYTIEGVSIDGLTVTGSDIIDLSGGNSCEYFLRDIRFEACDFSADTVRLLNMQGSYMQTTLDGLILQNSRWTASAPSAFFLYATRSTTPCFNAGPAFLQADCDLGAVGQKRILFNSASLASGPDSRIDIDHVTDETGDLDGTAWTDSFTVARDMPVFTFNGRKVKEFLQGGRTGARPLREYLPALPTDGARSVGDEVVLTLASTDKFPYRYIVTAAGTPGTFRATAWVTGKNNTANRPALTASDVGVIYMDTTLDADGKPIWWNGVAWVDATGAVV